MAAAQTKATLDVSETLFSVVAAMNVCGYDQELSSSSPIRTQVRADLVEASKLPQPPMRPTRCAASITIIGRAMRRTTWRNMSRWRSTLVPRPTSLPR